MVKTMFANATREGSGSLTEAQTVLSGRLFDGGSTLGREVSVRIEAQELVITFVTGPDAGTVPVASPDDGGAPPPLPMQLRHPLCALALGERWQQGAYPVGLPDGGTLWLDQHGPSTAGFVQALLRGAGRRQRAARLWRSWPAVGTCLLLLVAVIGWVDRQGVGLAARAVLPLVPLTVDETVGKRAIKYLDDTYLARSARTADDTELRRRFAEMAQACGQGRTFTFEVRRLRDQAGFNALALPDGTLVMLDGLLDVITEEEALAVLGHEIGHVVHRHGMGHLLKALGLFAVASTVFADFSSVLATTVGTVQFYRHSRDAEREADAHARNCLAQVGIDPRVMVGLWTKFQAERERRGGDELPGWLRTHPGIEERLRAAQQP
jgi:Zn-dependent protease with chaperone function